MGASEVTTYTGHIRYLPITILSGSTTTTNGIDLGECRLTGITLPATFDGTALTFTQADSYAGTYYTVNNGAGDLSLTVAASKYIGFNQDNSEIFKGIRYLKPVCGTSQSTTDTIIILHLMPVYQL